jgi:hypothetical protein
LFRLPRIGTGVVVWEADDGSSLGSESQATRGACRVGQRARRSASIVVGGCCSWVVRGIWAMFNMARVLHFLTLLPRRRAPGLGGWVFCLASSWGIGDCLAWGRFWSTRIAFCQYRGGWRGGEVNTGRCRRLAVGVSCLWSCVHYTGIAFRFNRQIDHPSIGLCEVGVLADLVLNRSYQSYQRRVGVEGVADSC